MNNKKSTAGERKLVGALFVLVLITFSLAQRDSKRLQYQYTLLQKQKANVAVKKATFDTFQVK